jgi:toluene monooxygenase system protein E
VNSRRTYWHLEGLKRKPTEYEIVSTGLLYYPGRGFEVESPVADWYRKHQQGSAFVLSDPDRFQDPRETTYPKYASIQRDKEVYVDGLMESIETTGYDRGLSPAWVRTLGRVLPPMRFPVHGLQMIAAYVGQMSPGSRLTMAALFQAADEMRRVQRIAYRMRLFEESQPQFGHDSRALWQEDPIWQPLRELVERLLVTYDWGEAFAALNLVLKPMLDDLFLVHVGDLASRAGDSMLGRIFHSLHEDARWHRDWSAALVRVALETRAENAAVLRGWIRRWHPPVLRAVAAFGPLFGAADFAVVMDRLHAVCAEFWRSAGLLRPLES